MRSFHCDRCGQQVYFENAQCGGCGALLGFVPASLRLAAFDPELLPADPAQPWPALANDLPALRPCANRSAAPACNWMLDAGDAQLQCRSCRLTTHTPDQGLPPQQDSWRLFEAAKRRLVYTLLVLGLAPPAHAQPGDGRAPAFRLLGDLPGEPRVLTGHDEGVVTLNSAEADPVHRETTRVRLGEPLRNLLGHLRHETSHYLQWQWLREGAAAQRCREVFGDESTDYAAALKQHYEQGPPAQWQQHYISAYASSHPWEDWAETCAHYLLMVDAVETAAAWGLRLDGPTRAEPGALQAELADPQADLPPVPQLVLEHWLPVAQFLNAMNRSLGERDAYPFLMPDAVLHKLATVQALLAEAACMANASAVAQAAAPAEPATAG